jgi:hypothetical protein
LGFVGTATPDATHRNAPQRVGVGVQMDKIRLELDAHLLQCEASLNRRIRHYEDRFNAAIRSAVCSILWPTFSLIRTPACTRTPADTHART